MTGVTDLRWPTVLFDFDGTLGNTIPLILASYRHTIERFGLAPADDATILSWIGRTLPDMFTELAGAERAPELIDAYSAWQADNVAAHLVAYPGVDELLVWPLADHERQLERFIGDVVPLAPQP